MPNAVAEREITKLGAIVGADAALHH